MRILQVHALKKIVVFSLRKKNHVFMIFSFKIETSNLLRRLIGKCDEKLSFPSLASSVCSGFCKEAAYYKN